MPTPACPIDLNHMHSVAESDKDNNELMEKVPPKDVDKNANDLKSEIDFQPDNLDTLSNKHDSKRLERSLGESCKKFLELFGAKNKDKVEYINVDDCIKKLNINRRRIYDIINILESFQMIKRLKKNEYEIRSAMCIYDIIVDIEVSYI